MIDFMFNNKKVFNVSKMGAGKSRATLLTVKRLRAKTLIVAPKTVALTTWPSEVTKWVPELAVCQMAGLTPAKRTEALTERAHIKIINYELLKWFVENRQERFDLIVYDESTKLKSIKSQMFKAAKKMANVERTILLTGTPAPNSLLDLWSQIYLLDSGRRLGKTITAYRNRFFYDTSGMGWRYVLKDGAQEEIQDLIKDLSICIEPPAPSGLAVVDVPVELPESVKTVYDKMKKTMVYDEDLNAMTAATLVNKLQQIATGNVYTENGEVRKLGSHKIDALKSIVEHAGENVVVVYQYKHQLADLQHNFPDAVNVKEPNAVDDWNAGNTPILLMHSSAGHGLNLQHGGRIMIWLSVTYNLEHYAQTNARLHRRGQTKDVIIYRVLSEIDHTICKVLSGKDSIQQALLDHLKGD